MALDRNNLFTLAKTVAKAILLLKLLILLARISLAMLI